MIHPGLTTEFIYEQGLTVPYARATRSNADGCVKCAHPFLICADLMASLRGHAHQR